MNKENEFEGMDLNDLMKCRFAYKALSDFNLLTDLNRVDEEDLDEEIKKVCNDKYVA